MSTVSAILALGFLIFIHELGHFLVAKKSGVGVNTFSLGFGPKIFGFTKGETEYRLSAIPLGGYVRMVGENPGEEVPEEDLKRSFSHKKVGPRLAIVAAGPLSNLVLAFVIYYLVLLAWGIPTLTTMVGEVSKGQPAAVAGIQKGDKVLAINGRQLGDWMDMVQIIQKSGGKPLNMLVDRQGRSLEFSINPKMAVSKDIFGEEHKVYRVGIISSPETTTRQVGPVQAIQQAAVSTYRAGELIFVSVVKLIQRKVSMDNLGGPILITQAASKAAKHSLAALLDLTALISVNLAILNLLPIPALDGGHLFFFLIEAIRKKPVSAMVRERAQQAGMALLLLLMAFIFYNDIARIVTGGAQ